MVSSQHLVLRLAQNFTKWTLLNVYAYVQSYHFLVKAPLLKYHVSNYCNILNF